MRTTSTRYLIVNGDDLGMSSGVNSGILAAHRDGILTSTSFMVDRPASEEGARLAGDAPELSVGLHLELDGAAVSDPRRAMEDQLARFEQLLGRPPTHADSHHDAHGDAQVLRHVREAARQLDIPVRGHSPVQRLTKFYGQWGGETHLEQVSVESLLGMLKNEVGEGVTELICHPGYIDGTLESSYAREREAEIATLCDPRVRELLRHEGIRLIGFRELPELLSASLEEGVRRS